MRYNKMMTTAVALLATAGLAGSTLAQQPTWCDDEGNCSKMQDVIPDSGEDVNVVFVSGDDLKPNVFQFGSFTGKHGYLGVVLLELTPELRTHFGVPEGTGVMVSRVEPDSPAADAGLQVGDVLTLVDGKKTPSSSSVARAIRAKQDGDYIDLEVWRDGSPMNLTATAAEHDKAQFDLGQWVGDPDDAGDLGNRFVLRFGDESAEQFNHLFNDEDFMKNLHSFEGLQGDLNHRIEELESKLKAMEAELESRDD